MKASETRPPTSSSMRACTWATASMVRAALRTAIDHQTTWLRVARQATSAQATALQANTAAVTQKTAL